MSHGQELYPPREADLTSRPSFGLVRRGYDRQQVDQHLSQLDGQVTSLATERERARAQVQRLATQLEQVQAQLAELRQRPP